MTAKEYLQRLRKTQINAENKQKQYERIRESITYLEGLRYDKERVQTSPHDALSETVTELVDAENEVLQSLKEYNDTFNDCVNKIGGLSKAEYIEILTRRYIDPDKEERRFENISVAMGYTYYHTCHLHGEALQEFEEKYLKN